ncbi:MAG: PQQ-binding-like beta-propeller repeat protein [Acidobacteriota bacterium]|nr:PQQ-binding-like beta-propeller repeat protein [Acidobacteriota bacterium]
MKAILGPATLLWALLPTIAAAPTPVTAAEPAPDVAMIEGEGESTRYWSRWRGPSGQGYVEGAGYVDRWGPDENVLWKVAVPGRGNSSPIVWGDRIFLTTAQDDGSERSILAFRRADGKLLWRATAPGGLAERAHRKNGHASGTATTDGERIYAFLGNHGLLAVDFDGEQVWHQNLGPTSNYHGPASSPLLYEDRVIVVQDQRNNAFVAAFDKLTGRELWRTPRTQKVGWNSPIAIRAGDRDEIVVSGQNQVQAYDPGTGEELWRAKGSTFEVIPSPVVGHGLVFCSSGRAGPTLAIRPGGSGDVTDTHVVWSAAKGSPFVPAPILVGDLLYLVNDMISVVTIYDARTGEVLDQERLGSAARESFSAAAVLVDGKVFVTNDQGETFVLRAGPEVEILHVNDIGERTLASPALVDGHWYIRTAEHLWAIGTG